MSTSARRIALVLVLIAVCIAADQASKAVLRPLLEGRPVIRLAGDFCRIGYVGNPGATLSLGAGLSPEFRRLFFVGAAALGLIGATLFALSEKQSDPRTAVALALIAGGGFGNIIDRVVNQGVVHDVVSLGFGRVRTGVFNLADVLLVAGLILLVWETWLRRKPRAAEAA